MDPTAVTLGIKVLGKLLSLGISAWHASEGNGGDLEKDIKVIQDLLSVGEQFSGLIPAGRVTDVQARYAALITSAFGEAWKLHFGPRRALDRPKDVARQVEEAINWALTDRLQRSSQPLFELGELTSLIRSPAQTRLYASLWDAFTHRVPTMEGASWAEPLIEPQSGEDRRRFEAIFRRITAEALAAPAGQQLRIALATVNEDRAQILREVLVADMATWGDRHVFGNLRKHATLPDMPLDAMYVEPEARLQYRVTPESSGTLCEQVREHLPHVRVLVVTGDFGHGKSLTARMLARDFAREYLQQAAVQGSALPLPVFVRCQDAVVDSSFDLSRVVKLAQWNHLDAIGVPVKDTDPALGMPAEGQHTIFILDGLDEVAFIERSISELFRHLRRQATGNHKIIVFTRPQVLPGGELSALDIPVLRVSHFTSEQIEDWLNRWNKLSNLPKLSIYDIRQRGLWELAQTPILLFMIAYVWPDLSVSSDASDQQEEAAFDSVWHHQQRLYEVFFRAIARGKHQFDVQNHPPVVKAAEALRDKLLNLGFLDRQTRPHSRVDGEAAKETGDRELAIDAMLWAMSRIAWEHRCLEQNGEELQLRHVDTLLADELKFRESSTQKLVSDGLLLTMQADLSQGGQRILFGHKSFREFLVAACWAHHLSAILDSSQIVARSAREVEDVLLRGRLMEFDDNSWRFLMAHLDSWSADKRRKLHQWAQDCFNDESILPESIRAGAILRSDMRLYLREAALAIGSMITEAGGIRAAHPRTLRSLLAAFWCQGATPLLWAPKFQSPDARLENADLAGANLEESKLPGALLNGADLTGVRLARSNLRQALLTNADLEGGHFSFADLSGANLRHANLRGAKFSGSRNKNRDDFDQLADHDEVTEGTLTLITRIDKNYPDWTSSNLKDTELVGVNLTAADLTGADLRRASFSGVDMRTIILRKATLGDLTNEMSPVDAAKLPTSPKTGQLENSVALSPDAAILAGTVFVADDLEDADLEGAILPDNMEHLSASGSQPS